MHGTGKVEMLRYWERLQRSTVSSPSSNVETGDNHAMSASTWQRIAVASYVLMSTSNTWPHLQRVAFVTPLTQRKSIGNRTSTSFQTQMIGDQVYMSICSLTYSYKWQYTMIAILTVYSLWFSLLQR
jgi:hypothetical protein